jgi:hypothetical protein
VTGERDALSAELEAALLRELREAWRTESWARFSSKLRMPTFELTNASSTLGRWARDRRTIELSRALVLGQAWPVVLEVLRHEMAHQFVDEALGIHDETAHGPAFGRVCEERGIDRRAAGVPEATDGADERVLEKVRRLLALAESPEKNEAEAAMRAARGLMLRYNLDALSAPRDYVVRHLGDAMRRRDRVEREIVFVLTEHFFVRAILVPHYVPAAARRGWVWEISGTPANVAMAGHVWAFLHETAARLYRGDKKLLPSGRARLAYMAGVVRGFGEKLEEETRRERGAGLVWVGDADLERFYRSRHPRTTARGSAASGGAALALGKEKGRGVVLHRPMETGRTERGRLLGSGD